MKKIYNILLSIFIISGIIVTILIIIKYTKNQINEQKIKDVIIRLEEEIVASDIDKNINTMYEGYNIEGIITIPKIDIKYPILSETTDDSMKKSIVKFWGPKINEIGNYTMAGHNNKDGTMFGKTKHLENGDIIKITDLKNNTIEYEIFNIYSIDPNDVSCVESVEPGTREITLITCNKGHKERLIVKARETKEIGGITFERHN